MCACVCARVRLCVRVSLCLMTSPETKCHFFVGGFHATAALLFFVSGLKQVHTETLSILLLERNAFLPLQTSSSECSSICSSSWVSTAKTYWRFLHLNPNNTWIYAIFFLMKCISRQMDSVHWFRLSSCSCIDFFLYHSEPLLWFCTVLPIIAGVKVQSGSRCGKTPPNAFCAHSPCNYWVGNVWPSDKVYGKCLCCSGIITWKWNIRVDAQWYFFHFVILSSL